ncbi:MAG: SsrA-binding protein SmpB [Bacteroidia bacterium]|nr:SsrA-binding protein SmpB [Bacteroidia bacterium]
MAKGKDKGGGQKNHNPVIKNRKARFEFHFLETFEVGIVLKGTEIKSIRESKVNLAEAFCYFRDEELWVKGMHISPYEFGNLHNVDPFRERKLLLKKKELKKLKENLEQKGLTIVVSKLFFNERSLCKLEIALAQGKKLYDKRQDMKEKDSRREMKDIKQFL